MAQHKIVNDKIEAAALAARAGVNVNCGYIYNYLPEAVEQGLVSEATIDSNLSYLMRTRFKLGLFDPIDMCRYNNIPANIVNCDAHRELAYKAASVMDSETFSLAKSSTGTHVSGFGSVSMALATISAYLQAPGWLRIIPNGPSSRESQIWPLICM